MYIDSSLDIILDTFQNYTKEWNEKLGVWRDKPLHDKWSNPADGIRYMCMSLPEQSYNHKPSQPRPPRRGMSL